MYEPTQRLLILITTPPKRRYNIRDRMSTCLGKKTYMVFMVRKHFRKVQKTIEAFKLDIQPLEISADLLEKPKSIKIKNHTASNTKIIVFPSYFYFFR